MAGEPVPAALRALDEAFRETLSTTERAAQSLTLSRAVEAVPRQLANVKPVPTAVLGCDLCETKPAATTDSGHGPFACVLAVFRWRPLFCAAVHMIMLTQLQTQAT